MIRDEFVKMFGEKEALALESAAEEHKNGVHDNPGSDPFKWVLLICIGYQCFEVEGYREYHGIVASFESIKQWVKDNAELDSHDGDSDFISLVAGVYNEYVGAED